MSYSNTLYRFVSSASPDYVINLHSTPLTYFLIIGMINGSAYVNVYMGSNRLAQVRKIGEGARFDDNNRHRVVIKRQIREVSLENCYYYSFS